MYISSIYKLIICMCLSSFIFAACLLPEIISSKIFQFEIWFSKFFFFLFKFQFNLIKSYYQYLLCNERKFIRRRERKEEKQLTFGYLILSYSFSLNKKKETCEIKIVRGIRREDVFATVLKERHKSNNGLLLVVTIIAHYTKCNGGESPYRWWAMILDTKPRVLLSPVDNHWRWSSLNGVKP